MKVLPEAAEYYILTLQCDRLLQANDASSIEVWGKDVARAVSQRYIEIEKNASEQDSFKKKKKPKPLQDDFLRELVASMGGVYKGHYHYEIPVGLPSPLHLAEVGKLLSKRAFEIQTFQRFLWGTGLILSILFATFSTIVSALAPKDVYSWLLTACFLLPLGYCFYRLREIAPHKEAIIIMRERFAKSKS